MKIAQSYYPIGTIFLFSIMLIILNINCQYDYRSPLPGAIEVRLRTISANIAPTRFTNFIVKIDKIQAIRSDGGKQKIYEDAKIIESSSQNTLLLVNTLDSLASTGNIVIGQAYAPPGDYIGFDFQIEPGSNVILGSNAEEQQPISVIRPSSYQSVFHQDISFQVRESQTIKIILTLDLDRSLIKGAYNYSFEPKYSISIQ
jgi:hypothetical protein